MLKAFETIKLVGQVSSVESVVSHFKLESVTLDITVGHVERKVPKYKYHKIRERKVKTLIRN